MNLTPRRRFDLADFVTDLTAQASSWTICDERVCGDVTCISEWRRPKGLNKFCLQSIGQWKFLFDMKSSCTNLSGGWSLWDVGSAEILLKGVEHTIGICICFLRRGSSGISKYVSLNRQSVNQSLDRIDRITNLAATCWHNTRQFP